MRSRKAPFEFQALSGDAAESVEVASAAPSGCHLSRVCISVQRQAATGAI